jgi:hypothetical protein|tara:strand:- start:357 stop:752 length:396 start_codon:yes stop_codon:yes gene_type:complete
MKLYLQPNGTVWALGLETNDKKEREQQFNSFFNHGAIDSAADLIEMTPSFSYIWTTKEKLEKYFLNSSLAKILTDNPNAGKGEKGGAMVQARKLAEERMSEIQHDRWINSARSGDFYTTGTVAAEKIDSDA